MLYKKIVRSLLIFFYCILNNINAGTITIDIFPDRKFEVAFYEFSTGEECVESFISGFKNDQVELIKRSIDMQVRVKIGLAKSYLLHEHSKFHYIEKDTKLIIQIWHDNLAIPISLSEVSLRRLLLYLSCEIDNNFYCNDFISWIKYGPEAKFPINDLSLFCVNEDDIEKEDIVVVCVPFNDIPSTDTQLIIKHFAFAVGNGLYISKFGQDALYISTIQGLLNLYNCQYIGVLR